MTSEWRAALQEATQRTRELFQAGRPVCDAVRGRLRWELRFTWLGGMRILENIEAANFDVFRQRPTLTAADAPVLGWRALRWSAAQSSR
jgi:phytoene/squalene synthetase